MEMVSGDASRVKLDEGGIFQRENREEVESVWDGQRDEL